MKTLSAYNTVNTQINAEASSQNEKNKPLPFLSLLTSTHKFPDIQLGNSFFQRHTGPSGKMQAIKSMKKGQ